MKAKGIFITGTDTGIGKTRFTLRLIQEIKNHGAKVLGMKPIASGAEFKSGRLINEDAELIWQAASKEVNYELVNPIVFDLPVAPHIAAAQKNEMIDLDQIVDCYNRLASDCGNIIVEGVGGWRVPVSSAHSTVDLVRELRLPVILVVGLKLGCINHAILTAETIKADNINLIGWVSNQLERDYLFPDETVSSLNGLLGCPHIASLFYAGDFRSGATEDQIKLSDFSEFLNL
jgi:dethiobiotin synthetase